MACFICGGAASEVPPASEFIEVDCPSCGFFGLPKDLADKVVNGECHFHVERTREYLVMRGMQKLGPWITPVEINIYQLLKSGSTGTRGG